MPFTFRLHVGEALDPLATPPWLNGVERNGARTRGSDSYNSM
jgi:hypothetical protein